MEDNTVELVLGRLHEVSQLYLDHIVDFMTRPAFQTLEPAVRDKLTAAYFGVTASLGRHSMSALAVAERTLDAHLPELFERLDGLSVICTPLGIPPMTFAFNRFRDLLLAEGVAC